MLNDTVVDATGKIQTLKASTSQTIQFNKLIRNLEKEILGLREIKDTSTNWIKMDRI